MQEALRAAMAETDPASLGAATRMRKRFAPEVAAWALAQAGLRRQARTKFSRAEEMLFTRAGLEQATREPVASWRAQRLVEAGIGRVVDLGCGIGADAMAFAAAGLDVLAVDADPETVEAASANLALVGAGPAVLARAEDVEIPDGAAVFLDPARRNERGRTWDVAAFSPPWDFVTAHLASSRVVVVKAGPGLPRQYIPEAVEACWVSHAGSVVEVSLWNRHPPGPRAVLLGEAVTEVGPGSPARPLPVAPVGKFVHEPDGAVIRAGLMEAIAPERARWLLAGSVAYLSSDEPLASPLARSFEVLEVLDWDVPAVRRWLREHRIGTVEIKVRAIDVDPAALRRDLRPKGPGHVTLILAKTLAGARMIACRRISPTASGL